MFSSQMLLQCSPLKFRVETTGPRAATAPVRAPWGHSRAQRPLILQRDWLLGVAFSVFFSQKARTCERSSFLSQPCCPASYGDALYGLFPPKTEGVSVPDVILPDSEDLDHPHFSMTGRGTQRRQRNVHESQQSRAHGMSVPLSGYRGNQTSGPMESSPNWRLPLPIHPTLMRIVDSASSMSSSKPSGHRTKEGIQ